jgi:C4-dicarboxylate-specific signal transduction histidine kinase
MEHISSREPLACIAHEVNQPLAAIVANAESCLLWLSSDRPDLARVRIAVERIVRNGHHASALIGSIRAAFRKRSPAISRLNLNEVIEDILSLMVAELHQCDIELKLDLCSDLGCVRGDRIQVQQVILNLVKNAVESMSGEGGKPRSLRISTSAELEGFALVAVEDCGDGIGAAAMSHIFDPFFTTKRDGMGVGLSICRSIVEAHGGRLCAANREPNGSVFRFTIPIANEEA